MQGLINLHGFSLQQTTGSSNFHYCCRVLLIDTTDCASSDLSCPATLVSSLVRDKMEERRRKLVQNGKVLEAADGASLLASSLARSRGVNRRLLASDL